MRGLDKWNKDIRKSWEDFKLSCLGCKRELLSHKLMAVLIIKFWCRTTTVLIKTCRCVLRYKILLHVQLTRTSRHKNLLNNTAKAVLQLEETVLENLCLGFPFINLMLIERVSLKLGWLVVISSKITAKSIENWQLTGKERGLVRKHKDCEKKWMLCKLKEKILLILEMRKEWDLHLEPLLTLKKAETLHRMGKATRS